MSIEIATGRLTKLTRRIRAKGGERVSFTIETGNVDLWHHLIAYAEGDVSVVIEPSQSSLPLRDGDGESIGPEKD